MEDFRHPFSGSQPIDFLETHAARDGARTALVWAPLEGPDESWSRAALLAAVHQAAAGLAARGVQPGDRIVLHAENCPEFLVTWLACSWLGAVCVATNPRSTATELEYLLDLTQATGAVVASDLAPLLARPGSKLQWIITFDGGSPADPASRWNAFGPPHRPAPPKAQLDPSAPGSVLFTSGTSSRPKAVLWSRSNALWAARQGALTMGLRDDDVALVFLPLYHTVGLAWSTLPALWAGATIVLQPRFSASRFWSVAARHRASFTSHVRFTIQVLAQQPVPATHTFRLWGNAAWWPEQEARFRVPIRGWWGMTEVVAAGIVGDHSLSKTPGSIGRAAPGYRLRMVDASDQEVLRGEVGELQVLGQRGVSVFSGYLNDPEATEQAFTHDGWFRTGDRVRLNADGSIQFVERLRDVLKTGGENVSAAEVERVILSVDGVAQAAVVGRPDEVYGEVGVAFVELLPGSVQQGLVQRVMDRCQAELAAFKRPRDVRILHALPLAGVGKVAKGELRRLALTEGHPVPDASPRA